MAKIMVWPRAKVLPESHFCPKDIFCPKMSSHNFFRVSFEKREHLPSKGHFFHSFFNKYLAHGRNGHLFLSV
jgi:hypothetical protein